MTHFNHLHLWLLVLLLSGCASPPEPVKVPWNTPLLATNQKLPLWQENMAVIPTPFIAGHWTKVIRNFNDIAGPWPADIWYALAHSPNVAVTAPDARTFFATKLWLRNHGVRGVISYRQRTTCLLCTSTDVYLSR